MGVLIHFDANQNEAKSACAVSTDKGVNWRSKYVTQVQQQRPASPTVTLTCHACKYEVHQLHQRYSKRTSGRVYVPYIYAHAR